MALPRALAVPLAAAALGANVLPVSGGPAAARPLRFFQRGAHVGQARWGTLRAVAPTEKNSTGSWFSWLPWSDSNATDSEAPEEVHESGDFSEAEYLGVDANGNPCPVGDKRCEFDSRRRDRLAKERAEAEARRKAALEKAADEAAEHIMKEYKNGKRFEVLRNRGAEITNQYKHAAEKSWTRVEAVRQIAVDLAVYNLTTLAHVNNIHRWIHQLRTKLNANTTKIAAEEEIHAREHGVLAIPTTPPPVSDKHTRVANQLSRTADDLERVLAERVDGTDTGGT